MEQTRRLVTEVPGPASLALLARRGAAVPRGVGFTTPVFARAAEGAIIEDVDGNRLIDLAAGLAVLNVGNAEASVVDAIKRQAELATHTCIMVVGNEPYIELAERLNALVPVEQPAKTILANSGAEAVENAVKIARYATGRPGVAVVEHAFHGRTIFAMAMTAKPVYSDGMGPLDPSIHRLPFAYPYRCPAGASPENCGPACADLAIARMREIGPETFACLVVEPILGEGGFVVPGEGYLPRLHEFCAEHGILFVADEVQTGMGRTGTWFGIEHEGIRPDLVATAKSLGGGLPLGAVTGRADLMDAPHVGGLGGTFGGNPVACAAALAVLDVIEADGLLARAQHIGARTVERLHALAEKSPLIGDVRGRGAMVAIELVTDRETKEPASKETARAIESCYRDGVVVLKAGTFDNVIRLLPPLTIDDELLDEGLDVLEQAVLAANGGTT
jgi:4-aminobutyrate aminotransferase/(S)-3-amino-2-methylpropionate transaminase